MYLVYREGSGAYETTFFFYFLVLSSFLVAALICGSFLFLSSPSFTYLFRFILLASCRVYRLCSPIASCALLLLLLLLLLPLLFFWPGGGAGCSLSRISRINRTSQFSRSGIGYFSSFHPFLLLRQLKRMRIGMRVGGE